MQGPSPVPVAPYGTCNISLALFHSFQVWDHLFSLQILWDFP